MLSDGTVIWTAPTGRTYKTLPGSRLFFPAFNTTTAALPAAAATVTPSPTRALIMPKRRRTRAADRAERIRQERAVNAAERAEWARQAAQTAQRNKPHPPKNPTSGK